MKKDNGPAQPYLTQTVASILTAEQQNRLADQLVEKQGPKGIDREHADLLSEGVASGIASYNPGPNDLSFIALAADILTYIVNAQNDIVASTRNQCILTMTLLKLFTMHMTLLDRWNLAYFINLIIKNGKSSSQAVKRDSTKLKETA